VIPAPTTHPALELAAVTTVNGNVEVGRSTDNSLRTLDWVGCGEIPGYDDALCIAALVDPSLIATSFVNVVIETRGEYTIGRTVVDHEKRTKRAPNCHSVRRRAR
jgi:inosine-uridine nucleoside N-ribohydrolase